MGPILIMGNKILNWDFWDELELCDRPFIGFLKLIGKEVKADASAEGRIFLRVSLCLDAF